MLIDVSQPVLTLDPGYQPRLLILRVLTDEETMGELLTEGKASSYKTFSQKALGHEQYYKDFALLPPLEGEHIFSYMSGAKATTSKLYATQKTGRIVVTFKSPRIWEVKVSTGPKATVIFTAVDLWQDLPQTNGIWDDILDNSNCSTQFKKDV